MTQPLTRIAFAFALIAALVNFLCNGIAPASALENPVAKPSSGATYFYGRMLDAADFQREQEYLQRDRASLNPYGQVSGLDVAVAGDAITISPGHAVTRRGDKIVLSSTQRIDMPVADGKYYAVVCAALHDLGRRCLLLAAVEHRKGRIRIDGR